jgi:hypothetical protein
MGDVTDVEAGNLSATFIGCNVPQIKSDGGESWQKKRRNL